MRHYQPYITKTIFSTANPPVTLRKIAVGDGALGSNAVFEQLPTVTIPVLFTSVVRQR
jgi:carboxypeptidase D